MKTVLILAVATSVVGIVTLGAQSSSSGNSAAAALARAHADAFAFRNGNYDVAPRTVAFLEAATQSYPDDGAIWNALAGAYTRKAAAASQPGADPTAAVAELQRAMQASDRALALTPNDPDALSNHGSLMTVMSLVLRKFEMVTTGMQEMNRAVALAPQKVAPRIARAFFGVNLPPQIRRTDDLAEDLAFLIAMSEGSKSGDTLHLLLGDLLAEAGRKDEARRHYEAAGRRSVSPIRETSTTRLTALDAGVLPVAEVGNLRRALATDCTMCHGR